VYLLGGEREYSAGEKSGSMEKSGSHGSDTDLLKTRGGYGRRDGQVKRKIKNGKEAEGGWSSSR